jgi:hypothetical protein
VVWAVVTVVSVVIVVVVSVSPGSIIIGTVVVMHGWFVAG